jgi:hypothetical protein
MITKNAYRICVGTTWKILALKKGNWCFFISSVAPEDEFHNTICRFSRDEGF